jgi:hypothetical protein
VSQVTRTLTAKVPVIPTYTQPLNNPAWNFIYSRGTGQTCDMTIANSVLVQSPLYVAGNLSGTDASGRATRSITPASRVRVRTLISTMSGRPPSRTAPPRRPLPPWTGMPGT